MQHCLAEEKSEVESFVLLTLTRACADLLTDRLDRWESCYRSLRGSRLHKPRPHFLPLRFQRGEKVSCLSERLPQTEDKEQKLLFMCKSLAARFIVQAASSLPDESSWPVPGWSNRLCWCELFPHGRACPHTKYADALVDTVTRKSFVFFVQTHLGRQIFFFLASFHLKEQNTDVTLTTVSHASLWAEKPCSIKIEGLIPAFPLYA